MLHNVCELKEGRRSHYIPTPRTQVWSAVRRGDWPSSLTDCCGSWQAFERVAARAESFNDADEEAEEEEEEAAAEDEEAEEEGGEAGSTVQLLRWFCNIRFKMEIR